jgi:hypothetical protein
MFIRDEIKTIMMFVSGLALACPAVIARESATLIRPDLVAQQQGELATPVTEPAPAGLALVALLPASRKDLPW